GCPDAEMRRVGSRLAAPLRRLAGELHALSPSAATAAHSLARGFGRALGRRTALALARVLLVLVLLLLGSFGHGSAPVKVAVQLGILAGNIHTLRVQCRDSLAT